MNTERLAKAKPLWLTAEEASDLLSMAVASAVDLGDAEERILQKLGEFCRACFRDEAASPMPGDVTRPPGRPVTSPVLTIRRRRRRSPSHALVVTRT